MTYFYILTARGEIFANLDLTVMRMVIRDLERICDSAVILFSPKSHGKKVAQNTYKLNSEHLCHRVEWNDDQTNITTRKLEFDLQTDHLNTELHLAQWLSWVL